MKTISWITPPPSLPPSLPPRWPYVAPWRPCEHCVHLVHLPCGNSLWTKSEASRTPKQLKGLLEFCLCIGSSESSQLLQSHLIFLKIFSAPSSRCFLTSSSYSCVCLDVLLITRVHTRLRAHTDAHARTHTCARTYILYTKHDQYRSCWASFALIFLSTTLKRISGPGGSPLQNKAGEKGWAINSASLVLTRDSPM